ncbi:MAG: 7-keto-8-aminopelargonate synthetase-like enzyme/NADP-dependent 3-hydroxy acid dehydrogenase YdfG [Bradymonadia bacterium]
MFDKVDFEQFISKLQINDPAVTVASCIQDHPYADASEARAVFGNHATSPVVFTSTLQQCVAAGAEIFLQVGAGGPVLSFAKGALKGTDVKGIFSAASKDDRDGGASFLHALAELWVRGVKVNVAAVTTAAPIASVPPIVMPRKVYWPVKSESAGKLAVQRSTREVSTAAALVEEVVESTTQSGVADIVISAVATASAYPKSALKPEMRLGEDLGFDSMMVADLAEELTKVIEGVQGIPQEILINSPTIADLIAFAENPAAYAGAGDVDDNAPLLRFAPTWCPTPLSSDGTGLSGRRIALLGPGSLDLSAALLAAGAELADAATADVVVWNCCGVDLPPVSAILADEAQAPDLAEDFISALVGLGRETTVFALRDTLEPWSASVAGALRSVAADWSKSGSKNLAFDVANAELVVDALGHELGNADSTVDVRYDAEVRFVAGTKRVVEIPEPWQPSEADIVCISGGTRGIGLELARRIAPSGAQLLLVGRSAPGDEAEAFISECDGRAVHIAVDVTDRAAVKAAFAVHGPVTAFVHSAGVLADGPLGTVDAAQGRLARSVKTEGFLNTLVAVNGSLKVALGIGSWSGRFGSRHQAHYAAGNAMLTELVNHLPSRIRGACAEFGPWSESDMASTIPEAAQQAMRAEGVDFVGNEAGINALIEDLGSGSGSIVRGRRVPTTTRVRAAEWDVNTDSHPYLLDHAIEGNPVMPLAVATTLLADVAGHSVPFEVRDMKLWKGVVANEPQHLSVLANRDRATISLGNALAYDATVRPLIEAPADLVQLTAGEPPHLSLKQFYDEVTFHGPMLQGIEGLRFIGKNFASGRVVTSDPTEWIPSGELDVWPIDPLVFDSAMQLAAFVDSDGGGVGTPVGFERFVQLREMPPAGTEVIADVSVRTDERVGDRLTLDLAIWDSDGNLLAHCDGLVVQVRDLVDAVDTGDSGEWNDGFELNEEWVNPAKWQGYKDLELRFQMVAAMGLQNPYFDLHEGTARDTSIVEGREVINFSSYNYLGLSGDERVQKDVTAAMAQYGTSVSASRIASGERPFHRDLEALLASSLGVEDAIIFPSGHATNVTVIGHLFGPNDLILHDELIHDSCLQGIKLSGAARRSFRHEDHEHAEQQLRELRPHYEKVLLLHEGVYSMDGDISNTPAFLKLKEKYGCMIMVDEAHSFGTIGPRGFGIKDHYGLEGPEVDLWMGTMSKSLASTGGWIGGTKELITYLRYTTPGFVFAAGMAPTLGQAALSSLKLMYEEPWRVEKVQSNAKFFCQELLKRGLDVGVAKGESPVVPVVTGDSMQALQLAQALLDKGINAKPIIFPAVADDSARLRFFLSTCHSEQQLEFTAETIRVELERIRKG